MRTAVDDMRLEEFTYFHQGVRTTLDFTHDDDMEHIASILENVADNYLGNYDCGICIFKISSEAWGEKCCFKKRFFHYTVPGK